MVFSRMRGRLRPGQRSEEDRRLEELTNRLADIVSPKIRMVHGYAKSLREPVLQAQRNAQGIVAALGDPVSMAIDRWLPDPLVNALFVSVDHLREVLFRNKDIYAVLGQEEVLECCFLLTCNRVERQGFGSRIEGEIIRRDIPQVGVTFTDHRVLAPTPDIDRTRGMLVDLALEFKAKRLAEHLLRKQARIRELGELRESMRVELKLLDLSTGGLHAAFSDQATVTQKRNEFIGVMQDVQQELDQARAGLQDLKDYLDYMRAALMESEEILAGSEVRLWLDEAGIISSDQAGGSAREVRFLELASGDLRRVTVLAKVERAALKKL